MKTKSRESKLKRIAQFEAEARELAGAPSANQVRFLRVAKEKGEELEPVQCHQLWKLSINII